MIVDITKCILHARTERGGPKGIGSNGAGFIQPRPMSSLCLIRQVCALKTWARKNGVNEAKDGTMSSYVLTLLMINYLQASYLIRKNALMT